MYLKNLQNFNKFTIECLFKRKMTRVFVYYLE